MKVFYVPGSPDAIDYAIENDAGELVGMYGGKTLAQVRARYPEAIIGTEDEFIEQQERALTTEPQEIDEACFCQGYSMLPPLNWRSSPDCESFAFGEFYAGNVTNIYARHHNRYWRMRAVATLPHDEIMRRVRKAEGLGT